MSYKDFFLGLLAGAVAGIMLSPKSGRETREGIKKYYSDIKDKVLEKTASVKEITKETYGNVVDAVVEGYRSSRKITASEAAEIKADLKEGYDRIKAVFSQSRPA